VPARSAWKTSKVEVWTARRAPAWRAAAITFSAPIELTRSKIPESGIHCSKIPMQLNTPSTPSAA
jgi:hypothetical protein